jgi:hypothetical protein
MGYELVANGQKQFAIDWDIVRRIVRSYHTSCLQLDFAREVTMSESHWYNPMTWSLPDISHVEVDWDLVRRYAEGYTHSDLRDMRVEAKYNAARIAHRLEDLIDTTRRNKEVFVDWIGTVQTQNMQSVNRAVEDYESNIEIAKFVRDMSADGLMVGASVMSGGAAVAALGGAAFFKGTCTFQDTDSVGASVMEGAGSFAFAYVKLVKEDLVLAVVQAPYKAGTELVGGATVSKAALSGAVKLTGPAVDNLFKLGPAKTLFDKVAVPIVITYGGENVASKVLARAAGKTAQKGVEAWGKSALATADDATGEIYAAPRPSGPLVAESTLSSEYLLYLAFVNMEKGIGRGW